MPKVVRHYEHEARESIIRAGLTVFREKGYHRTTMEDVAKKLGVSRGALYQYFANKSQLFRAISEEGHRRSVELLHASFNDDPLAKALETLFDHLARDKDEGALDFELLSEASRDASLRKILKDDYEENLKTSMTFLNRQREIEIISEGADKRSMSIAIVALLTGLMASLVLGQEKSEARRTCTKSIRAMLEGWPRLPKPPSAAARSNQANVP